MSEFRESPFRHRDTLISGIEAGTVLLNSGREDSDQTTAALLNIFKVRLKRLDRLLLTESNQHLQSLREDVSVLCDGLRSCPDERCDFWLFDHADGGSTCVYIGRRSRAVMGCVYNRPDEKSKTNPLPHDKRSG